jgi:hypothetical protein
MTELKGPGRTAKPLVSAVSITDGMWHRVGLTWDGTRRVLCVDDVEVARDTQSGLASSTGGLYIGTGSTLAPGSFWCGLIDDIRIYNRVVTPSALPAGFANMVTDGEPCPARRVLQQMRLRPVGW